MAVVAFPKKFLPMHFCLGGRDNRTPVPCSFDRMQALYADPDSRIVEETWVGDRLVKTLFLPFNHQELGSAGPPVVFETLVVDPNGGIDVWERYSTWNDAVRGHDTCCYEHECVLRSVRRTI